MLAGAFQSFIVSYFNKYSLDKELFENSVGKINYERFTPALHHEGIDFMFFPIESKGPKFKMLGCMIDKERTLVQFFPINGGGKSYKTLEKYFNQKSFKVGRIAEIIYLEPIIVEGTPPNQQNEEFENEDGGGYEYEPYGDIGITSDGVDGFWDNDRFIRF